MKVPSEPELIELENQLAYWLAMDHHCGPGRTLRTLIDFARDPTRFEPWVPPQPDFPQPPRTVNPEPVSSLAPKQKRKSR